MTEKSCLNCRTHEYKVELVEEDGKKEIIKYHYCHFFKQKLEGTEACERWELETEGE